MRCPIWGTTAKRLEETTPDVGYFDSPRAGGRYAITGTAGVTINALTEYTKMLLTTWLVEQRRAGVKTPKVTSAHVESAKVSQELSIGKRADSILIELHYWSTVLGAGALCRIPTHDGDTLEKLKAVSESSSLSEVIFLLEHIENTGRIVLEDQSSEHRTYKVTFEGYEYLEELKTSNVNSVQGFIAMWFDASLDEAFTLGFEPGIKKAGYNPFRIDGKSHNNKIDDEIVAEIRRSRFVVADFTQEDESGARGGVYYEAGFAHGLNIPVIFTCREDAIKKVHFDTRQYNHITWTTPEDLADQLAKRISATIGDGPLRKAN